MRPSTRSAGKPKTPISSAARMTSCVTLSSAKPRKPLTSPGAAQRSGRLRARGGVESPRLTSDTSREIHAPAELAAMGGHRLVVELHHRGRPLAEHEPGGVGDAVARRSEEHTSELQSLAYLVCRLLLEKKKKN